MGKKTRTRDVVVGEERTEEADIIREKLQQKLQQLPIDGRLGGDGESVPETPPNEAAAAAAEAKEEEEAVMVNRGSVENPFSLSLSIDSMALLLFVVGVTSRMVMLEHPRNVVFDEMHYGKYAAMYLKNTFFFDANPPPRQDADCPGGIPGRL